MNNQNLETIKTIDIRFQWKDEAQNFTPWLAREENLKQLSEKLDMELELEGTEIKIGKYKADIIANDTSSKNKVIIENQLEKTNHDHLGKILTYAAGIGAKTIIWVAKEFEEEHRKSIDYLNDNTSDDMRFYGIQIQLFKIGNSHPAPYFNIVAGPNEYTETIKNERQVTVNQGIYLDFWNNFKDYCKEKRTFLSLRKAFPQLWFSIAIGRSNFSISLTASTQLNRIGCEIYIQSSNAKKYFKMLEKQKIEIEQKTGQLEWQQLPEGKDCRIVLYRHNVDITDEPIREELFLWLKEKAELFHKTFSSRIKALPND